MADRVAILLATNYSGSHLLSHLLSAHSQCFGVGELHRYGTLIKGTGAEPVVSDYNTDKLFAELDQVPQSEWHATLLRRFRSHSGIAQPLLVDNSKKVNWARAMTSESVSSDAPTLLHLIRDPRALVLRWLNTYSQPNKRLTQRFRVARRSGKLSVVFGDFVKVCIYKWLRENKQITDYLDQSGRRHAVITYRDMVFETEAMLRATMPLLGLDYEPDQLNFGEGNQYGTRKTAHADSVQRSVIKPDVKWQQQLDAAAIAAVENNMDVKRYLDRLDLSLVEDGLTQASNR